MTRAAVLLTLLLAGCATNPQLVMLNPRTGATVDCQQPNTAASPTPADFLVSHACLSACEAHGFRPVPGIQAPMAAPAIPDQCSN